MKRAILLLACVAALAACTRPTDEIVPSDKSKWDKELAPVLKKLSEADYDLFTGYLARVKTVAPGTTVADALADQKKWEAEEAQRLAEAELLKKQLELERARATEQLNKAVTVTLLAKHELPKNYDLNRYSEYQAFRIGVQNNTDKPLAGVAGEIKFIDVFDKEVGAVSFRISERIAPGKSATWNGGRDYNQFVDMHRAVWNLEEGKYTTRFVPEMVVFQDGTKLTVPQ